MKYFIHKLADVQSVSIGIDTKIWQFTIVLKNAVIGSNCNVNANVFIENDVVIGDNVTIKSGVQIWDGVTIEDDVFIGPNATFTNDITPRSKQHPDSFQKTVIKQGASVGANSTIIPGIIIEKYGLIGAGSVLTKSTGKNELWLGNPAKKVGFVTNEGETLNLNLFDTKTNIKYKWEQNNLVAIE